MASFRVVSNILNPFLHNSKIKKSTQTINEQINNLESGEVNLTIADGTYNEDVNVPDGINLYGNVYINGDIIVNGTVCLHLLSFNKLICKDGIVYGSHLTLKHVCGINADISLKNCIITHDEYALNLDNTKCVVESCTIEGHSKLKNESVLDCKNVVVIGNQDLFQTEEKTTVQLFGCMVTGKALIKSGPGTSIRGNVFALGSAKEFVDGDNIKLDVI